REARHPRLDGHRERVLVDAGDGPRAGSPGAPGLSDEGPVEPPPGEVGARPRDTDHEGVHLSQRPPPVPAGHGAVAVPVARVGRACYTGRMRQVGVWVGMVVCVLGWARSGVAQPPADVLAYGVFAIQSAAIGSKARVQGDVGCLFGELSLGQSTRVG